MSGFKAKFVFEKKFLYIILVVIGLGCQVISNLSFIPWGTGLATFIWIFAFLELVCLFRSRKNLILTGIIFALGYGHIFMGALGKGWTSILLPALFGLIIYGGFCISAFLMLRWDNFLITLVLPCVWLIYSSAVTALNFPTLVRVDMMFTDMPVLMQMERLVGSTGMSCLIIWLISLLCYAVNNHKRVCLAFSIGLFFIMLIPGMFFLYPNEESQESVRTAYTTGPYIGDFIDYTPVSYEVNEKSLENSVESAAAMKAQILVFSEEAFEIDDKDEARFLETASSLAKDNNINLLIGLDITDTDNSENGKSINMIVLIDSQGREAGSYQKTHLIPILESTYEAGDGTIPSNYLDINGRSVKISYLICYDSNFTDFVKKIDDDTDILFLPSWDWSAITDLHAKICQSIAMANHVCLLKPTYDGLSITVDSDGEIIKSTSTDDTGYETVQLVDIPLKDISAITVSEDFTKSVVFIIIATEIFSVFICINLLLGNLYKNKRPTKRSRYFTLLVLGLMAGCLADALSWILDGSSRLSSILFITTLISIIMTYVLVGAYIAYLTEYIKERKEISDLPAKVSWIYMWLALIVTFLFSLHGDLFYFEDGCYKEGSLYSIYVVANIGYVLVGFLIVFIYRKALNLYDRIISYIYMAIPVLVAMINLLNPNWSFTYPAATLSVLMVFIMIQSDRVEMLENEGKAANYTATHDALTGLLNRYAYQNRIDLLKEMEGNSGVIFSDLNGLKYTNDNFGHEAGDQLLIRYSKMLSDIFLVNELYRISGDEFVCIMENVPEDIFNNRLNDLKNVLQEDQPPLACSGAAYGRNHDIEELVRNSETLMYEEKDIVHQHYPKIRR